VGNGLRRCIEMLERHLGAGAVAELHARRAERIQLVDVLEGALAPHHGPVPALDDEARLHRGTLALERRRAVALADLALDVLMLRRFGPADAGHSGSDPRSA